MLRPRLHLSLAATPWSVPGPHPDLEPGTVHVWRFSLDDPAPDLLSAKEEARFARFYYARDRRQRRTARARLRQLLGRYLEADPATLRFGTGRHGKPFLTDFPDLRFNLAHAGGWGLVAVSRGGKIGVDLEHENPAVDVVGVASHFFSRVEVPVILGYPVAERHAAFFRAWTRKEALIKAHGDGLSLPLAQFGVSIRRREEVAVLHTD
ncbi:MAG: 4'-phosphopantetheinyl transferase superfamily protein, partial [Bacteroidota bacterium]